VAEGVPRPGADDDSTEVWRDDSPPPPARPVVEEQPPETATPAADPRGGDTSSTTGSDDTWTDLGNTPAHSPIAAWREVELFWKMRKTILRFVVGMFGATLAVVTLGLGFDWFSEEFAGRLADIIIPVLLAATTAIVATLFTDSSRK
jgi:hypothetical protein